MTPLMENNSKWMTTFDAKHPLKKDGKQLKKNITIKQRTEYQVTKLELFLLDNYLLEIC